MRNTSKAVFACILLLCLAGCISLVGCSYRPVYDASTPVRQNLAQVRIMPIAERSGQKLRNLLIDRIYHDGIPKDPTWQLQISLIESNFNIDVDRTDTATRAQLILQAQVDLMNIKDGSIPWSKNNRVISSYNVLVSPFGTLINEDDARDRALTQLADDVASQLGLFFSTAPSPTPTP